MKIRQETAEIIKLEKLVAGIIFKLTLMLESPEFISSCQAGRFVRLQPLAPRLMLPRPLAVYHVMGRRYLQVVIRVVGQNTKLYSQLQPGDRIIISGPHGQPIKIKPEEVERIWLIGGGGGLPALHPLAALLGRKASVIAGFKTKAEIFGEKDFERWGSWFNVATDDGTIGHKGTAADLFTEQIKSFHFVNTTAVYTCGPVAMMKAVAKICRDKQIPCFAFLERVVACGYGACKGCSVFMTDGRVLYVCEDGPVFPAEEVDWNALSRS